MITYVWRNVDTEDAEVNRFLDEAAAFDAEQGFGSTSAITPPAEGDREALVRVRAPRGVGGHRDWELAAHVRVVGDGGRRRAQLLVRPRFRSLGVATALVEELCRGNDLRDAARPTVAVSPADALDFWAFGHHPAAERLASRFDVPSDHFTTEMVRPLRGVPELITDRASPEGLTVTSAEFADLPVVATLLRSAPNAAASVAQPSTTLSVVARVGRDVIGVASASEGGREVREWTLDDVRVAPAWRTRNVGRNLVIGLLGSARRAGADQMRATVPHDPILVGLARSIGFHHDQTNTRYSVDLNAAVEQAEG